MKMEQSPVKKLALARGIPVYQPAGFRDPAVVEELRRLEPDVIAVVAYGRILPQTVLDLPPKGCVNIHASLLPPCAAPVRFPGRCSRVWRRRESPRCSWRRRWTPEI